MKRRVIIFCATLSLVCLGAWAIQAQTSSDAQTPTTIAGKATGVEPQHIAINRQTSVDCNICFTCGGDWPIFAGIDSVIPGEPNRAWRFLFGRPPFKGRLSPLLVL